MKRKSKKLLKIAILKQLKMHILKKREKRSIWHMITDDEKIRKAHEIYYKRNGIKYRSEETIKNKGVNKIVILLIIGFSIIIYQNQNNILNTKWLNELKSILNTKINFNSLLKEKNTTNDAENIEETSKIVEVQENIEEYKIIWPYKGEITSYFGKRESENENIDGNHTGIDIAGNYGDEILSSITGTVIEISEEGNLGKHIKIANEEYTTVYAHCSEILKKQGEEIEQGDVIAKIGSTGNSTRKPFAL
ncbi:MAG: M23 family metallopeptidase [Clostridia bacterium]